MKIGEAWIGASRPVKRLAGYLFQDEADKFYFMRVWSIAFYPIPTVVAFLTFDMKLFVCSIIFAVIAATILAATTTFLAQILGGMAWGLSTLGRTSWMNAASADSYSTRQWGKKARVNT